LSWDKGEDREGGGREKRQWKVTLLQKGPIASAGQPSAWKVRLERGAEETHKGRGRSPEIDYKDSKKRTRPDGKGSETGGAAHQAKTALKSSEEVLNCGGKKKS